MSGTTGAAASERILATISEHLGLEGPLLPILHAVQAEFGYVPQDAVAPIAKALNITRAEVHGVMSFYHDFRTQPVSGPVVKICRAEACQAQGGRALEAEVAARLSGATVEAVYCLGLCANGPAAMVGDRPMAAATLDKLAAEVAR